MNTIPFVVSLPDKNAEDDEMGLFGRFRSDAPVGLQNIPADRLKENLVKVSSTVMGILKDIQEVGQFNLKEVTLAVEISAEGGVSLIGTSKFGGKGAITLKFKK